MKTYKELLQENKKTTYVLYGRKFKTVAFKTEKEANEFLAKNRDYGALASDKGLHHMAKLSDKGIKESFNESVDPSINKVVAAVKGKKLMQLRKPLEDAFGKKNVD